MSRGRSNGLVAEINVTPLIDVMLVLLIVFMLVTPVATGSLEVAVPRAAEEPPTPPPGPPLVLRVSATALSLNGTPLSGLDELGSRLNDLLSTRSDRTVVVSIDGDVAYGTAVEVLDVARGAGADRIGLLSGDGPG